MNNHTKQLTDDMKNSTGRGNGIIMTLIKMFRTTGKLVVLDISFCIIPGLIGMRNFGAFAAGFIKNCRYWPIHVPGQEKGNYTRTKYIGDVTFLCGKLDYYNYDLFCVN